MCRSLWQTPAAFTLISTCVPVGCGVGASTSFRGALKSATWKLFIASLPKMVSYWAQALGTLAASVRSGQTPDHALPWYSDQRMVASGVLAGRDARAVPALRLRIADPRAGSGCGSGNPRAARSAMAARRPPRFRPGARPGPAPGSPRSAARYRDAPVLRTAARTGRPRRAGRDTSPRRGRSPLSRRPDRAR